MQKRKLTELNIRIIKLVAKGLTDEAIANKLKKASHTIRGHITRCLSITNTHSKAELVSWAYQNGILKV